MALDLDIVLPVASAPEIITTIVSWNIYDGIWDVLNITCLLFVPLFALMLSAWSEARQRGGDRDGVQAALLTMETRGMWMLGVLALAGVPLANVNVNGLTMHRQVCTGDTRVTETVNGSDTGTSWQGTITTLNGQTVRVPLWWALVQQLSSGLNNAAIASIPCTTDIRATSYALASNPVSRDGTLTRDLADFAGDCFLEALGMARNDIAEGKLTGLTEEQLHDLDWFGSAVLLNNTAYYQSLWAKRGVAGFVPADRLPERIYVRDSGGIQPTVGRPSCAEWWTGNGGSGLRERIISHINKNDPDLLEKARGALCFGGTFGFCSDAVTAENKIIRDLLTRDGKVLMRLARSAPGAIKPMDGWMGDFAYASSSDYNDGSVGGLGAETAGVIGSFFNKISFYPMITMARAAALPAQAITMAAIVIALPFILLFSSYSIQTLITVTFGIFAVRTWNVIWAFARYLDDNMIISLRAQGLFIGISEYTDVRSHAIDFVIGTIYLVGPAFWVGLLGWAGWNIGKIYNYVSDAGNKSGAAGAAGGSLVQKTVGSPARMKK